jgi:hypothetical protein
VDGMAANLDLYATFAQLVGESEPVDKPGYISQDLTGTLLNGAASPRTSWAFHRSAFRSGKYKIHTSTQPPTDPVARAPRPATQHESPLLYDLQQDIAEQKNIAGDLPEVVQRLLREKSEFEQSAVLN